MSLLKLPGMYEGLRHVRPGLVTPQILKKCYSTYHIECLRPVHRALNVDKKN